jgi:hypothetical protein
MPGRFFKLLNAMAKSTDKKRKTTSNAKAEVKIYKFAKADGKRLVHGYETATRKTKPKKKS